MLLDSTHGHGKAARQQREEQEEERMPVDRVHDQFALLATASC